ncbi:MULTISPECIES: hypothetical protein [Spirosoma]|uniref:Uncharacterized protein n=1 Tax=Spirosoma liriopis TaxID=2937440 RepID=A0ABT0HG30_9BACT|nr:MULTISPECIES: hypothetical protein [Spirosoma]MCK8491109.1 hypothetical protein [Spirosoma liriopis]UHG90491.1 hypothetical protein LQ777_19840 [Spirosoma oryzicola]
MRSFLLLLSISLYGSICFGQADSSQRLTKLDSAQTPREASPSTHVPIPGVDTPLSGPGTMMQAPANPTATAIPQNDRKKRKNKTNPPTDPRAFGVGIPIGKTKKDSLR